MSTFQSLRDLCRGLFAEGFGAEDIVDIVARDAAEGLPDATEEGVRVAFTLTYAAFAKVDGRMHDAIERLVLGEAGMDDADGA